MVDGIKRRSDQSSLRERALSRWENEGGAADDHARSGFGSGKEPAATPDLTGAELVQLRIRMIALEGLVAALLAEATDQQLDRVRRMAVFIAPRPGFTQHALTIRAAAQIVHLVDRAVQFRESSPTA
jgi:hypothetical protein